MGLKRGLSQVVTTLLFVLIALGAVLLVWNLARGVITEAGKDIEVTQFNLDYELPGKSLYVNAPREIVSAVVKRGSGEADVKGLEIVLEDESGTSVSFRENIVIGELESKRVDIDYSGKGLGKIVKVGVAPVLENSAGEEVVGNVLAESVVAENNQGSALSFDGVDDVNLGSSDKLDFPGQRITLSAWIKPNGLTGSVVTRGVAGTDGWGFWISSGKIVFGGHGGYTEETGVVLEEDKWYHISAVGGDSNEVKIYLDGIRQTSTNNGGLVYNVASPGDDTFIGIVKNSVGTAARMFYGVIDDVRIYDRSLTDEEVTDLAEGDYSGAVSDGLVAWYMFDENEGSTAKDSSGNGNDGVINGNIVH